MMGVWLVMATMMGVWLVRFYDGCLVSIESKANVPENNFRNSNPSNKLQNGQTKQSLTDSQWLFLLQ